MNLLTVSPLICTYRRVSEQKGNRKGITMIVQVDCGRGSNLLEKREKRSTMYVQGLYVATSSRKTDIPAISAGRENTRCSHSRPLQRLSIEKPSNPSIYSATVWARRLLLVFVLPNTKQFPAC